MLAVEVGQSNPTEVPILPLHYTVPATRSVHSHRLQRPPPLPTLLRVVVCRRRPPLHLNDNAVILPPPMKLIHQ